MMDRVDDGDDSEVKIKVEYVPTYFPSCNFLFLSFFWHCSSFFSSSNFFFFLNI